MSAFANVVEDSWNFKFVIQSFCSTVKHFRANHGQKTVDRRRQTHGAQATSERALPAPVRAAAGWPRG
jgi:hypothetical protein